MAGEGLLNEGRIAWYLSVLAALAARIEPIETPRAIAAAVVKLHQDQRGRDLLLFDGMPSGWIVQVQRIQPY